MKQTYLSPPVTSKGTKFLIFHHPMGPHNRNRYLHNGSQRTVWNKVSDG